MFLYYSKYFIKYLFFSKGKQKLLFLALLGLFLSSFALLVLQSTMTGLQEKTIGRSKSVMGSLIINISNDDDTEKIYEILDSKNILYFKEYEVELFLTYGNNVIPVMAHGIEDNSVSFYKNINFSEGIALSYEMSPRLNVELGNNVSLISPSHSDPMLGDIPSSITLDVSDFYASDVPEIDAFHVWTRLSAIQNLVSSNSVNRIRVFNYDDSKALKQELSTLINKEKIKTWEEQNATLVWSLKLESTVMVFLFVCMSLLVSLCITSGHLLFFRKLKTDLVSFWILGMSQKEIEKFSFKSVNYISIATISFGLIIGSIFLMFVDQNGSEILPRFFVDRKIPVILSFKAYIISFLIPYLISIAFSISTFNYFKKDLDYLGQIRSV